ncbi:MAG TPA: recombinase family protein [Solirubrobacteraceae bacterium]|jgi:DNA invertase Pin-like site-specific DNA recombinase|nr:recombinase family protein [Solirubrobacteraceae bacterium]
MSSDIEPHAAVIYAAKSTKDKHQSIPTQVADCEAMAEREGWTVAGTYSDEGFSAYSGNRGPELADARAHAGRLAAETGQPVMLLAQHSDRFSRGAGDKPGAAEALIEIWHRERRRDVHLRTVQDDFDLRDSASVANMGARNTADSARKSASVKDGKRRRAEQGKWSATYTPDGLMRIGDAEDGALDYAPERKPVIELIWSMALAGSSCESIQLALATRGHRTPLFRGKSRPFTTQRVSQILNTYAYAGIVQHKGEVLDVEARWPRYVEPEDFWRMKEERARRACTTKRSRGRQATRHVIRGLAVCGECGRSMLVQTDRKSRKDGTRRRTYVCAAAHEHHRESEQWCPAAPFDAEVVDATVLNGLDGLLADADALREGLDAGRQSERERLERVASEAQSAVVMADKSVARADELAADAFARDDAAQQETLVAIATKKRAEAERERGHLNAALDAISELDDAEPIGDAQTRLLGALSGSLAEAEGDLVRVNAALREWLRQIVLTREPDNTVTLRPFLGIDAGLSLVREKGLSWGGYRAPAVLKSHQPALERA